MSNEFYWSVATQIKYKFILKLASFCNKNGLNWDFKDMIDTEFAL